MYNGKNFLGAVGVLLVLGSIYCLDSRIIPAFPNCYTLFPTFGTVLIIVFTDQNTWIGRILCFPLVRWIGLISYSLYLWHQPILAYLRINFTREPNEKHLFTCLIIAVVGSILSYKFIEKPFRNRNILNRTKIFVFSFVGAMTLFIGSFFLMRIADRRISYLNQAPSSYLSDIRLYGTVAYLNRAYHAHLKKYPTFSNSTRNKVMLIGDSHSQDVFNMIVEGHFLKKYEICVYRTQFPCQIYFGPEDRLQFIPKNQQYRCIKGSDIREVLPLIRQANIVIFASRWLEWSISRLKTTIQSMNLTKSQKLIIIGTKNLGNVSPNRFINKTLDFLLKSYIRPSTESIKSNQLMLKTLGPDNFVNLMDIVCPPPNRTCPLFTPQGKLISFDGSHLTKFGALHIGNIIFHKKPLNQL